MDARDRLPLRLLAPTAGDGPTQMALDEALLEAAEAPTLRLYRWEPPTLSLGCFQDHDAVVAGLPRPMPVVRRISGGGAIWHEHEVTYCLVGGLGEGGLPERLRDWYRPLHRAVAATLARRGRGFALQAETVGDRRYREEPRCFASPAADDLVAGAGKALGSAGRARGGRGMVHGSLKLASNPWDGSAVVGCGLPWDDAAAALIEGVCSAFGFIAVAGEATAAELAAARRILDERYGDDGWVRRREGPRA